MRRNRRLRWLLLAAALAFGFWLLRTMLSPSVDREALRISIVERGDVMATISASGVVTPRNELVISSNFPAQVGEVLAVAGAKLAMGDPILVLDSRQLAVDIQDLQEKLGLKNNDRLTAGLKLERASNESTGRYELRQIDLESHQAKFKRLAALAESGLISKGDLLEAQLDVRRSAVQLRQLEDQLKNQLASNEAELERIGLEAAILQNQLDEKRRLLDLTTVRAPRAGVLTWVLDEIGSSITEGMPLARIADLSAFRVEATLSDFYASRLREGLPVVVDAKGQVLHGSVKSVLPTVENGAMHLIIELDDPAAAGLRPQLRVDVEVVTGISKDTLRLRKGLGLTGSGQQQLYRLIDGQAIRTPVQLGLSNRDYVEVIQGLSLGDEIIVSSSSEFEHLAQVEVD